jgi:hypothetical protein
MSVCEKIYNFIRPNICNTVVSIQSSKYNAVSSNCTMEKNISAGWIYIVIPDDFTFTFTKDAASLFIYLKNSDGKSVKTHVISATPGIYVL